MRNIRLELDRSYVPLSRMEINEAYENARRAGRILPRIPEDLREVIHLPFDEIRAGLEDLNPDCVIGAICLTKGGDLRIGYSGGLQGLDINGITQYLKKPFETLMNE